MTAPHASESGSVQPTSQESGSQAAPALTQSPSTVSSSQKLQAGRGKKVDLFAAARTAQLRDETACGVRGSGAIKVIAPAKVNLFLGIGARRCDGYHEAMNIMHAVNLHDILYVRRLPGAEGTPGLTVRVVMSACEGIASPDVPSSQNIAHKAIVALAQRTGHKQHETIEVHIEKHIPYQAGLGGGSSDAAAALLAAAQIWGISSQDEVLENIAHELGSDVAFFLRGGCARFGGTGEIFQQSLSPMKKSLVLIKPEEGVSTAAAYRVFDERPELMNKEVAQLAVVATDAAQVPLYNNLASASERVLPLLVQVRTWAADQLGVEQVLLCGSGSTTLAMCENFDAACRLSAAARQRGWWSRTTTLGSMRAAIVPSR